MAIVAIPGGMQINVVLIPKHFAYSNNIHARELILARCRVRLFRSATWHWVMRRPAQHYSANSSTGRNWMEFRGSSGDCIKPLSGHSIDAFGTDRVDMPSEKLSLSFPDNRLM